MIDDFVRGNGVGLTVAPGEPEQLVAALERMFDADANVRFREAAARAAATISWADEQHKLSGVYGLPE